MQVFKDVVGEVCGDGWNEGIKERIQTSENLHDRIGVIERSPMVARESKTTLICWVYLMTKEELL